VQFAIGTVVHGSQPGEQIEVLMGRFVHEHLGVSRGAGWERHLDETRLVNVTAAAIGGRQRSTGDYSPQYPVHPSQVLGGVSSEQGHRSSTSRHHVLLRLAAIPEALALEL
jgi:hypothetical protein